MKAARSARSGRGFAASAFAAMALIAAALVHPDMLPAQEAPGMGFLRPRASLSADFIPKSGFDGHEISFRSFQLSSTIPLGGPCTSNEGSLSLFQAFIGCNLGLAQPDISLMNGIRNVEKGTLSVSALIITSTRNMYALSAGVSVCEEINGFSSLRPTPYCLGLGTWRANDVFTLVYGLSLAYTTGVYRINFPLFPILGFNIHMGRSDRISVILPLRVSYTHRFDAGIRLIAFISGENSSYRVNNHSDFIYLWGRDRRITLRLSSITTGLRVECDCTEDVFLKATAAFIAGRRISFLEKDDSLYRGRIAPSVYASLSAGIRFGSSEMEGESE
jgi:hypothetical protein